MNADERQLITSLFERMRGFGAPDKDREAEALISQLVRANPDAAYMLVQSVLVQEQALQQAGGRIEELEERVRSLEGGRPRSQSSGGFLGGVWGGGAQAPTQRTSVPAIGSRAPAGAGASPWSQGTAQAQPQPAPAAPSSGGGGGFMKSALATAAGVAGGMLLANSIGSMLGGGAHASPHHDAGAGGGRAEDANYADERDNDPGTTEASYQDDGNDPGFDSGGGELDI